MTLIRIIKKYFSLGILTRGLYDTVRCAFPVMNCHYRTFVGILLVALLTLIALFQEPRADNEWDNRSVRAQDVAHASSYDRPFYFEGFVTEGVPGNICHVPSITPLADGRMACVWYQGSHESGRDVSIYFSAFDETTSAWTKPVVLLTPEQSSHELKRYVRKLANPLIFSDAKGRLWLIYASNVLGGWAGTSLNYKVSIDLGHSWSDSRKLILSPFFNLTQNVKNKGIEFDDGSLLVPVYQEFFKKFSQIVRIIPEGASIRYTIWKMTSRKEAVQPSLVPNEGKNISAFFRNTDKGYKKKRILTANSSDLGRTWSDVRDTVLPNPSSGFDMIAMSNRDYLAVINNVFAGRSKLTLMISSDKGSTWRPLKVLGSKENWSNSYASINRSRSGLYHITYSHEKKSIRHVLFNEAWVRQVSTR